MLMNTHKFSLQMDISLQTPKQQRVTYFDPQRLTYFVIHMYIYI